MTTGTWNRLSRGTPVHTPEGTMGGIIRVYPTTIFIIR